MGVLVLLRHGQASMGTADYDQLSELGHRQARAAGARLARADPRIGQVWSGGLARQDQTARAVLAELGRPPGDLCTDGRLDEYDPAGILGLSDPFAAATTPESRRALQVTLDEALARWIQGGAGYPEPHAAFTARVQAAVGELAALPGTTLAVTSAGVIAVACARVAGLPADRWPALARVVVNASLTKLITGSTGTNLLTFNDHGHLEDDRSLITYR
ncbi:MAG TPA: histidine phosphatase family protein [Streptosporangiaceae bacterium]|nr:histidine phosphatase family protein [Streptosporangiaceae bacterium]